MYRDFVITKDPPDTKGHLVFDNSGKPIAVIGCGCDFCFCEMVNSERRREDIFGPR